MTSASSQRQRSVQVFCACINSEAPLSLSLSLRQVCKIILAQALAGTASLGVHTSYMQALNMYLLNMSFYWLTPMHLQPVHACMHSLLPAELWLMVKTHLKKRG